MLTLSSLSASSQGLRRERRTYQLETSFTTKSSMSRQALWKSHASNCSVVPETTSLRQERTQSSRGVFFQQENSLGRIHPMQHSLHGIDERSRGLEHLTIGLTNAIRVEFERVPRSTCCNHIPASCICSLSIEVVPRVNDIPFGFAHLLTFCI